MKIIRRNQIVSVTASSANNSYPATNLLDRHPKRKWKAASSSVSSATLSVVIQGEASGVGLVGIEAESATVYMSDPNGIVWGNVVWGNVVWATSQGNVSIYTEFDTTQDYATLWVEFPQFDGPVDVQIILQKSPLSTVVLAAGVLVAGEYFEVPGPQYGLVETLVDYSTVRQLSNGATYLKKRDLVREFSGTLRLNRDTEYWQLFRRYFRDAGQEPMLFHLTDADGEWTVYGRLSAMPTGTHDMPTHSQLTFQIIEEL